MRAIVASSAAACTEEALLDVVSQLCDARRAGRREGCALVFASEHHAPHARAMASALGDILHSEPFLGWFGAEAFCGPRGEEGSPHLVVLILEGCVAVARTTPQHGPGGVIAAGLCAEFPAGSVRFLATSAAQLDVASSLLAALDEQWKPIAGAACEDRGAAGLLPLPLLGPGLIDEPSAALLAVRGVRALIGVYPWPAPNRIHHPYRQARGSALTSLGGRPPPTLCCEKTCSVRASPTSSISRSALCAGALSLDDEIPDEAELFFALRDDAVARAELEEMLHRMKDVLDERRRIACLLFSERVSVGERCLFQNVRQQAFHLPFLQSLDSGEDLAFTDYIDLVLRRSTRAWWGGEVRLLATASHPLTGENGVFAWTLYTEDSAGNRVVIDDIRAGHAVMRRCAPAFVDRLAFVSASTEQRSTATAARTLLADEGIAVFLP